MTEKEALKNPGSQAGDVIIRFTVPNESNGERLDAFLAEASPEPPLSFPQPQDSSAGQPPRGFARKVG